jgi:hypothetical protein
MSRRVGLLSRHRKLWMIGADRTSGVFIMADREHPHTSKPGMAKSQRHMAGKGGQDALLKEREHSVKRGGTVGRHIPDQSKEKNTEIAVDIGHKVGAAHRAKHPDKEHK